MGAAGYITFYDKDKVNSICVELNRKYDLKGNERLCGIGYSCNFTVQGQYCYIVYWDTVSRKEGVKSKNGTVKSKKVMDTWHNYDFDKTQEQLKIFKEFEDRCNTEAVLVKDQEIWT